MRPIIKPKLNQCKRFVFFAALPYPLLTAANSKAFTKSARPPQQPLRFVPHILFLVATVILIYKFVSMVKTGKSSPKEISSAQDKNTAVEKEAAPYQFIDLRKKIEGFWRGYAGGSSLNIHVFSWGDSFLMDMTSEELGIKHQYYVFSGTLSDDYKFYAEGCETYTFLFNAEMDTLFFAEKGLFLNRVSL